MKREMFILTLLAILCFNILAYSQGNWFNAGNVIGNIVYSDKTGIVEATLDLGELESASSFSVQGNGSITVSQEKGLNLTRFLMTPHLYYPEPKTQKDYWLDRFVDLTVNFSIDSDLLCMPIITDSVLMTGTLGWLDAIHETSDRSLEGANYCYYDLWSVYHLTQGVHTVTFTLYGYANLVTRTLPVEISFILELSL